MFNPASLVATLAKWRNVGQAPSWGNGAIGPLVWSENNSPEAAMERFDQASPKQSVPSFMDRFDAYKENRGAKGLTAPMLAHSVQNRQEQEAAAYGPQSPYYGPLNGMDQPPMAAAMAQAPTPMPMPRPPEAPQQEAPISWWMKNAMMQQDPTTGQYLDPEMAAKAMA